MAQTSSMGSSPLANMAQGLGQAKPVTDPRANLLQQLQANMGGIPQGPGSLGMIGRGPASLVGHMIGGTPTPTSSTGYQSPPGMANMANQLSSMQGMQPHRMQRPGMVDLDRHAPGAPGQGPGGGKGGAGPQQELIKQQAAGLPGAPGRGPGAGKAQGQAMKRQMASLPGAPGAL